MPKPTLSAAMLAGFLLTGCATTDPGTIVRIPAPSSEADAVQMQIMAPPGAQPGTCWGQDVTPAVVETVTEQIMLQPAEIHTDGRILSPAIYKTETQQRIVKERRELWFETPCDHELTPDFIASVQRALKARGHYKGAITSAMDPRTRRAIRLYQKPQGIDSNILSLAAARKLGLVAVELDEG